MAPKASQASASQRRIKITASKQIRNRSRRQRSERAAGDGNEGSEDEVEGEGEGDDRDGAAGDDEAESQHQQRHQQRLLDIFRDSFRAALEHDSFATVLQEIKQALYERQFESAFTEPRNLEVYAARWSPTRALCYARVLDEIRDELEQMMVMQSTSDNGQQMSNSEAANDELAEDVQNLDVNENDNQTQDDQSQQPHGGSPLRVLAIGGGAAELVAFGSYVSQLPRAEAGRVTLLDVGPWGEVVQTLHEHVTATPVLSKYANAAARTANAPLVAPAGRFSSAFVREDILDAGSSAEGLRRLLSLSLPPPPRPENVAEPLLITLLFTLNELYTTSGIGKTTRFLRSLTAAAAPGTLLLVVDSPGSYSEASVGKEGAKKKYPMQWLLDHTLLHSELGSEKRRAAARRRKAQEEDGERQKHGGEQNSDSSSGVESKQDGAEAEVEREESGEGGTATSEGVTWEKIEAHSHESAWFRMPEGLRYPIALENMRYQMHLYRAV